MRKSTDNSFQAKIAISFAITFALALAVSSSLCVCSAQPSQSQVIENGGTGPYKSVAVGDASLPSHVIYRPANLNEYVNTNGKIPVVVYANGACANSSLEMSRLLSETASKGYLLIAIGPYEEYTDEMFYAQWRGVVKGGIDTKPVVIMGNGEQVLPYTPEEIAAQQAEREAAREKLQAEMKKMSRKKSAAPAPAPAFHTYAKQLLEAVDWISAQASDPASEYYHLIDLDKIAAMGQSCGGAQVLAVAYDPRIKTCLILNSGMGEMSMSGASRESLNNLHTPMLYLNGGEADIAYGNANMDYEQISPDVPVAKISTLDGHHGTYYEKNGGRYAVVVGKWLDWQLKGRIEESAMFLSDEYGKAFCRDWKFTRKNFR